MNYPFGTATMTTIRTIVFEPAGVGGGSLWDGDSLLATLTVFKRAGRQGRLSLRSDNRALDMALFTQSRHTSYRMTEAGQSVADAEWNAGEPAAALHYQEQDYIATWESLSNVHGDQLLLTIKLSRGRSDRQMELSVVSEADLPLIAFYLFVAHDLNPSASPSLR